MQDILDQSVGLQSSGWKVPNLYVPTESDRDLERVLERGLERGLVGRDKERARERLAKMLEVELEVALAELTDLTLSYS